MNPPAFLVDLLTARSPSGYEGEAQSVVERYLQPSCAQYRQDAMGNQFFVLNPMEKISLMLAGHIDEIGFIIKYIDDNGFLYFDMIGGHDVNLISGRRVCILTKQGIIKGITGKRAIHLLSPDERKKPTNVHDIWIDIGVHSKKEALELVRIGDVAVYDQSFELIRKNIGVARAFDDKVGVYVVGEALRRLSKLKTLSPKVVAVATVQEEVGCRGAITAGYSVNPQIAIAVDVGHATDHPDCDKRKYGEFKIGGGPIICRGANINPLVFERLVQCAEKENISYQLESNPGPTGTDARSIQISREGVYTGLVSIPLRYMHTPNELIDLEDVENGVKLLVSFAKSLKQDKFLTF
jgi:tetrahedral aminopeptidase